MHRHTRRRILVLNNYSFDQVWGEIKRGEKPDHHLYGINYFESFDYEVIVIPFHSSHWLSAMNRWLQRVRFPIPLGDLDQQWSCLRYLRRGDIIYSPCQTQTHLLCYLKALRLLRVPIINLAHHPSGIGRLERFRKPFMKLFIRGTDEFPALSQKVAEEINALVGKAKSAPVLWGPDEDYYPSTSPLGSGVVAAGRTGRDFLTFGRAASQTSSQAQIICLKGDMRPEFQEFGPNVQVIAEPDDDHMKYPDLIEIYARARVLAIPLTSTASLAGLTSLMDALGMGKPVIMTRHPLIDIDIESEGIGKWVEIGDTKGWRDAIQFFEDHEDAAREMGIRARELVEKGFNSASFARQIKELLERDVLSSQ